MIESGKTYERAIIERYIQIQKGRADFEREEMGDEFDDEDYKNYFMCPITLRQLRLLEDGTIWMKPN